VWIASGRRDMRAMPKEIRRSFGVALYAVQTGVTPPIAKVLKGFGGAGVLELIENDTGGTFRAAYTIVTQPPFMCCMCSKEIQARQGDPAT
jgi:phage-related protein